MFWIRFFVDYSRDLFQKLFDVLCGIQFLTSERFSPILFLSTQASFFENSRIQIWFKNLIFFLMITPNSKILIDVKQKSICCSWKEIYWLEFLEEKQVFTACVGLINFIAFCSQFTFINANVLPNDVTKLIEQKVCKN